MQERTMYHIFCIDGQRVISYRDGTDDAQKTIRNVSNGWNAVFMGIEDCGIYRIYNFKSKKEKKT